ncbi:MAG TPA: hypothetical protein PK858_09795, partial [Saprospiraceae bacterium]|nr:hypothetical protein [Saprospiraceae bacterium]
MEGLDRGQPVAAAVKATWCKPKFPRFGSIRKIQTRTKVYLRRTPNIACLSHLFRHSKFFIFGKMRTRTLFLLLLAGLLGAWAY